MSKDTEAEAAQSVHKSHWPFQRKFPKREGQGMETERPAEVRTWRACPATLGSLPPRAESFT